jgi:hypothetical protein
VELMSHPAALSPTKPLAGRIGVPTSSAIHTSFCFTLECCEHRLHLAHTKAGGAHHKRSVIGMMEQLLVRPPYSSFFPALGT